MISIPGQMRSDESFCSNNIKGDLPSLDIIRVSQFRKVGC